MVPLVGVHGFGYAPGSQSHDPGPLFVGWAATLDRPISPFSYYSYPLGLSWDGAVAYARALAAGCWNKYSAAYNVAAPKAADALADRIDAAASPVDIVAHSLGCRVALLAIALLPPGKVRKVLLSEGALIASEAPRALPAGTTVLNVRSRSDRVLEYLGALFSGDGVDGCIGRDGIGRKMAGWFDVCLDDPATQARVQKARGWALDGTPWKPSFDPGADARAFEGHWRAYQDPDNAPLYRAWFAGDLLADIVAI